MLAGRTCCSSGHQPQSSRQHPKQVGCRCAFDENGRKRKACNAEPKTEHQEGVKNEVGEKSDDQRIAVGCRIAQGHQGASSGKGQHERDSPRQGYGQVGIG